jgi:hypothetical protein
MNASPELICSFNFILLFRTYTVFAGKAKEMRRNKNGISDKKIPAGTDTWRTLKTSM